jgi:hypothetical protein
VETALTAAVREIAILEERLRHQAGISTARPRSPDSSRTEFQK